jgi:hypothetical protein
MIDFIRCLLFILLVILILIYVNPCFENICGGSYYNGGILGGDEMTDIMRYVSKKTGKNGIVLQNGIKLIYEAGTRQFSKEEIDAIDYTIDANRKVFGISIDINDIIMVTPDNEGNLEVLEYIQNLSDAYQNMLNTPDPRPAQLPVHQEPRLAQLPVRQESRPVLAIKKIVEKIGKDMNPAPFIRTIEMMENNVLINRAPTSEELAKMKVLDAVVSRAGIKLNFAELMRNPSKTMTLYLQRLSQF